MKKGIKNVDIAKTGVAILNYLRDHPDAEDTAEGISQWWVGETQRVVEKALGILVREGAIDQRGNIFRASRQSFSEKDKLRIMHVLEQMKKL